MVVRKISEKEREKEGEEKIKEGECECVMFSKLEAL